jgi:NADH dehydrogenase (ubiquinone) Fe-S protein 8
MEQQICPAQAITIEAEERADGSRREELLYNKGAYPTTSTICPGRISEIITNSSTEKLLSNGDKWEPELAAAIRADSPYR